METQPQQVTPILEVAWRRFAQLDAASLKRSKSHLRMRRWIAALGVLATLFAILTEIYPATFPAVGGLALKFVLILTPITASILAAFVSKFFSTGDWLVTRAGAEEILKRSMPTAPFCKRSQRDAPGLRNDWRKFNAPSIPE